MFKKILSLFKTQPELANQITASASALPSTTAIPPRMVRSKRKKKRKGIGHASQRSLVQQIS